MNVREAAHELESWGISREQAEKLYPIFGHAQVEIVPGLDGPKVQRCSPDSALGLSRFTDWEPDEGIGRSLGYADGVYEQKVARFKQRGKLLRRPRRISRWTRYKAGLRIKWSRRPETRLSRWWRDKMRERYG